MLSTLNTKDYVFRNRSLTWLGLKWKKNFGTRTRHSSRGGHSFFFGRDTIGVIGSVTSSDRTVDWCGHLWDKWNHVEIPVLSHSLSTPSTFLTFLQPTRSVHRFYFHEFTENRTINKRTNITIPHRLRGFYFLLYKP